MVGGWVPSVSEVVSCEVPSVGSVVPGSMPVSEVVAMVSLVVQTVV